MKRGSPTFKQPDQTPFGFMMPEVTWTVPTELPDLRGRGALAIDTEDRDDGLALGRGPGWVYNAGFICGVAIATEDRAVYAPIRHPDTANLDEDAVRRWTADHMASTTDRVWYQNAPFDLGWFGAQWGLRPPDRVHDTMAAAYTLAEDLPAMNLDAICRWQGLPGKDETILRLAADAMGLDPKRDMWRIPARYVGTYAETDAVRTLALGEKLYAQIAAEPDLLAAYELEADLIPMVLEMRRRGIRIDTDEVDRAQTQLLTQRDEILAEMTRLAGRRRALTIGDLDSPRTMEELFKEAGEPYPHTEKGNPSFKTEWMEKRDHWLPRLATRAMKMHDAGDKFLGQYIRSFTHLGRIHAEIHQFRDDRGGTVSSRFAYSNPPLQQMPSRDELIAKLIRSVFLPEPGELWAAPDYSQQELRLMVHFAILCRVAGVEAVAERYRTDPDTDYHTMTSEITRLPRRKAKDVTFAKAFGAGIPKFATMTGLPRDEAAEAYEQYDRELPFVKRLSEFSQARANHRGYLRLLDGARARFDRWEPRYIDWDKQRAHMAKEQWWDMPTNACSREEALARTRDPRHFWYQERVQRAFTHKSMNRLIQGSAARQTKLAMRACWRERIVPLLQMHDELSASVGQETVARRMQQLMVEVVRLEVPVKVDLEFGINWGQAKVEKKDGVVVYDASWNAAWARLHAGG